MDRSPRHRSGRVEAVSTFPIRWTSSQPKSEITPLAVQRHDRKKVRQEALDEAYKAVEARDANRCRVTGVALSVQSVDAKTRREHHHLVKRSAAPSQRADVRNIVLVSAFVHDLITRGWIVNEGSNADQAIFWHWTPLATSKPIVIKRHNKIETPDGL